MSTEPPLDEWHDPCDKCTLVYPKSSIIWMPEYGNLCPECYNNLYDTCEFCHGDYTGEDIIFDRTVNGFRCVTCSYEDIEDYE